LSPYTFGLLALGGIYILSFAITRSGLPWALARGKNDVISTSLLQLLIFTAVTVFAYVTAVAARLLDPLLDGAASSLPQIPLNLMILMGLSVVTATGSKGLTISYIEQNRLNPNRDESSLATNREGETDLTKAQMLIWTLIAAVIYLAQLVRYISLREYAAEGLQPALPDIDGTLLVLMGVSQGGYLAGKVVSRATGVPAIEHLLPQLVTPGAEVTLEGLFFGESRGAVITQDPAGREDRIPEDHILAWSGDRVRFKVPDALSPAQDPTKYLIKVRVDGKTSNARELVVKKIAGTE
jgi:hypothetical protein